MTYNDLFAAEDATALAARAYKAALAAYGKSKSKARLSALAATEVALDAAIAECDRIREAIDAEAALLADAAIIEAAAAITRSSPTFDF